VPVLCLLSFRLHFRALANPFAYDGVERTRCCGFTARCGTDIGGLELPQGVLAEGEAELETPFATPAMEPRRPRCSLLVLYSTFRDYNDE